MPDFSASNDQPHVTTPPFARRRTGSAPSSSARLQAVPQRGNLFEIADDVVGLKTGIVNAYFLGAPGTDAWVLVDAGLPGYEKTFLQVAAERFGEGVPPVAIVLTHAHFDHIGSLRALLRVWPEVKVYLHAAELPFVTGRSPYPPPDPTVGGGFMAWSSPLLPRGPIELGARVEALPADGTIPSLPEWRVIETPGHAPGHISLFRDQDRLLIAGDAVVTVQAESLTAYLSLRPVVQRPPAYFTPDWPSVKVSLLKIAELRPAILATGHGVPLFGEAMERALGLLAYEFERHPLGLPKKGRYREIPALFDEEAGLVRVPPLPLAPYLTLAAVLAFIGVVVAVRRSARSAD